MIERIIDYCARNRFIVIVAYLLVIGAGIWALVVLQKPEVKSAFE